MNRKSLFGRLAKSTMVSSAAERQEYFRVHLEPLEDRKMLAVDIYYAENWVNVSNPGYQPVNGNTVSTSHFGGIGAAVYGTDAFGIGSGSVTAGGNAFPYIHHAITDLSVNAGDTLNISGVTHAESDIVVSKALTIVGETGNLIVPEVVSSGDTSDFGAGTHSAFIITSGSVTIKDINISGDDGAGGLSGTLNFHHGITTLYTNPGGGYVTVRDGSLTAPLIGVAGEHGTAETIPNLLIENVTVQNVFWHGITLSPRVNETFHRGPDPSTSHKNLTVRGSTVTNVGPSTKTTDHIGLLLQNIVSSNDTEVGNAVSNTITNVGIGVKAAPYGDGSVPFYQDGDGLIEFDNREDYPSNNAQVWFSKVHEADIYAYDNEYGTGAWSGNQALDGASTATAFYILHSSGSPAGVISDGYGIALHVLDGRLRSFDNQSPWRKWRFGGTWETDDIVRMTINGQSVQATAGSVTITDVIDTFVTALNASGNSEFSVLTWSRVDNDLYAKADNFSANATGTLETFDAGPSAADTQTIGAPTGYTIGSDDVRYELLAGSVLTGPGTGVSGSVGIQINNESAHNNSSAFRLTPGVTITGYETGVRVVQDVTPGNQRPNVLVVDGLSDLTGNGTDILIGTGSIITGEIAGIDKLKIESDGKIDPRFSENVPDPWFYSNNTAPLVADGGPNGTTPIALSDRSTTMGAASITLGSGTTYTPLLTGQTAAATLWDFNEALGYASGVLSTPLNFNGSFTSNQGVPAAGTNSWGGLVTQNGSSDTLVVSGGDTGIYPFLPGVYAIDLASETPGDPTVYVVDTQDLTGADHINVTIRVDSATDAQAILFGLIDNRGNVHVWGLPTGPMNAAVGSYVTTSISLLAPRIEVFSHEEDYGSGNREDLGINLSKISGYLFIGDGGLINGAQEIDLDFTVDNVDISGQKNSALKVSGAINLGGATLDADLLSGYVPALGQLFTIVNNTSGGATTGTFAGLAEGGSVIVDGLEFEITYVGGVGGNDVVLERVSTVVPDITITDVSQVEGNAGSSNFVFSVTLSAASGAQVTVQYATSNGTAVASDYTAASGTLTFAPSVTSQLVTVLVTGNTTSEADETFNVNLSSATNGTITDALGLGTILNDDAAISISDVVQVEGNAGTSDFVFTVNFPNASAVTTTVQYTTANGTATTADSDYTATNGTLTYTAGQVSKTVTVQVTGDTTNEGHQNFLVNLSAAVNGTLTDSSGNGMIVDDDGVVARRIFYNQSSFDGNNAAMVLANDNSAIATDKSAYIPGTGLAVFSSVTSYSRGINGIIVDIKGSHPSITADDFIFKTGNDNTPSAWTTLAPTSMSVFATNGASGFDRVEIIWASGTIRNKWLEVQVLANADTGLTVPDVFFWGNRIGDTGIATPATIFQTTTNDGANVNANIGGATVTSLFDFNKVGGVTTADFGVVNANIGTIRRINIGIAGPFAPEGADDGGGGSGVASALAAPSSSGGGSASGWLAASLAGAAVDAGSGGAETAKADSARSAAVADVADELEDDALDELLADLAAA